jgi:transposase
MSQFQLVPYDRIRQHFAEQIKIPVSSGSVYNFNEEAYEKLEYFEKICKDKLSQSALLHVDETGINLSGKNIWLHCASNDLWSYFYPHHNRGLEAMVEIGILPEFRGVMVHDHWKPYYHYKECKHALCNSHHLRELQKVIDVDKHVWGQRMQELLYEINEKVKDSEGFLAEELADQYRQRYRVILNDGELEAPLPPPKLNKNGKESKQIKRSDARNLLERLQNFEEDVLRFMTDKLVPFTNNQAENEIRMTKVQQKISGCFRSEDGAKIFCRIRGYILTCQKHGMSVTESLKILFEGKMPHFCSPGE